VWLWRGSLEQLGDLSRHSSDLLMCRVLRTGGPSGSSSSCRASVFVVKACATAPELALEPGRRSRCRCSRISVRLRRRRVHCPRLACSRCGGPFGAVETSFRVQRGGLGVTSVQRQVFGDGTCPFAGLRALVCPPITCCHAVETSRERVGLLNTGSFLHSVSDGRARVRLRLPPLRAEVRFGLGGPNNWRCGSVAATKRELERSDPAGGDVGGAGSSVDSKRA
jgi:hypothetical protein